MTVQFFVIFVSQLPNQSTNEICSSDNMHSICCLLSLSSGSSDIPLHNKSAVAFHNPFPVCMRSGGEAGGYSLSLSNTLWRVPSMNGVLMKSHAHTEGYLLSFPKDEHSPEVRRRMVGRRQASVYQTLLTFQHG